MLKTQKASAGICLATAKKLSSLSDIETISLKKENFIPHMHAYSWDAISLSHGIPGLICLFSEMNVFFSDLGWDKVTRSLIAKLVETINAQGIHNDTLFSGLTGICFSLHLAFIQGTCPESLFLKLHSTLLQRINKNYIQPLKDKTAYSDPMSFDVISGISGIISYLVEHCHDEKTKEVLIKLTALLVKTTDDIIIDGKSIPGWYIPSEFFIRQEKSTVYSHGCFDNGMAHGVAGYLAALSKVYLQGIQLKGLQESIEKISDWLEKQQCDLGASKKVWPGDFGFNPNQPNNTEILSDSYRDSWCYGATSIAFSLFLSSCALKDSKRYNRSIDTIKEAYVRFEQNRNLECPSFCHGLSGLLTLTHQMYLATKDECFSKYAEKIHSSILENYNESYPFGFKSITHNLQDEEFWIDNPGLLDGTVGTLLSLLFFQSKTTRPWLSLFMLR